ncbi:hypothetical protein BJ165DRAFT_1337872 [Panaeolus papilionaceus]|nr:hypothetical protein BJ165DRAFT_1337872 [Panaeolus papilionaceus]
MLIRERTAPVLIASLFIQTTNAYWLMAANNVLTTQRIDPIMNPGTVANHAHGVLGASNFGLNVTTAMLRASQCTSIPILEDMSNYWYPQLYFQWANGSFTSVAGNPAKLGYSDFLILDYLFSDTPGATTPFPDDFRMISGDYTLRSFDPSSFAQQAVTFLCLDFDGKSSRFNELPKQRCPSGIRSQINFPSCWDGVNLDSADHRSHVAFLSTGPDNGTCSDPDFPVTLPRIFLEVYWYTQAFDDVRRQAMTPNQPFTFSNGDPIGYSYHADFFNGWNRDVLKKALDECNCNPFGDPTCCAAKGTFTFNQDKRCFITNTVKEQVLGVLPALPGNNPVQATCFEDYGDPVVPALMSPVSVYTDANSIPPTGTIAVVAKTTTTSPPSGTCLGNGSRAPLREGWRSCLVIWIATLMFWMFLEEYPL